MIDLLAIINAANSIAGTVTKFYAYLTKRAQTSNLHKKLVFRELRDNLKRLEHRNQPSVKLDKLIHSLRNEAFTEAYHANFDFNELAVNSNVVVTEEMIISKRNRRYIGWDCEKLAESIDTKIVTLKDALSYYENLDGSEQNLVLKLNNLYFQILLLVILVNQSKK